MQQDQCGSEKRPFGAPSLAAALHVTNEPNVLAPWTLIRGDLIRWQGMNLRYVSSIASDERIEEDHLFGYIFAPADDDDGPERHLTTSQVRAATLLEAA